MKIERFEDLVAWQEARKLVKRFCYWSAKPSLCYFRPEYDL